MAEQSKEELELQKAKELLSKNKDENMAKCKAEIEQVLAKYGCRLVSQTTIV